MVRKPADQSVKERLSTLVGKRLSKRTGKRTSAVPAAKHPPRDDPQAILHHWREAVPNDRLAHLVKDATRVFMRALQLRLAGYGVSFGHWTFLRILWEHDGLTQRELSNAAGVMEPTTHAALNAMEQLGLVERRRLGGDQRHLHSFLTPAGKRLKSKLVPHAIAVNDAAVLGVKAGDIATTRRVLLQIIENLANPPTHNGTNP